MIKLHQEINAISHAEEKSKHRKNGAENRAGESAQENAAEEVIYFILHLKIGYF